MEALTSFYVFFPIMFLLLIRWREKSWFPPSSIFAIAFFCHAICAPIIYDKYNAINGVNLEEVLSYAVFAYCSALIGYFIGTINIAKPSRIPSSVLGGTFLQEKPQRLAALFVVFISIYGLAYGFATNRFDVGKGAFAYAEEGGFLYRIAALNILVPSIMLAIFVNNSSTRNLKIALRNSYWKNEGMYLFSMLFLCLLVISLISFERGQIAKTFILCAIFYHYRVRNFRAQEIFGAAVFIYFIQTFASLRTAGVGIGQLTSHEIAQVFLFDREIISTSLEGLMTAIPGQEVLAQLVNIVPSIEPYKFGSTYLSSLLGLLVPRILGLSDYQSINTPAYWFKEVYAPDMRGNGMDFSMLSEAYLNFGVIGIVLISMVIGYIVARLSRSIRFSNSYMTVFFSIVSFVSIMFALRSDSNTLLKAVVFLPLPVYLLHRFPTLAIFGRRR